MRLIATLLAFLIACCAGGLAQAQDRVALVIGNDRYGNLPADKQLGKAVNDARSVGGALEKLGFKVIRGENLNRAQMVDHVFSFTQAIKPGDTAIVFFAGHGVAFSGGNYLLPTDIPLPKQGEEARARNLALGEADIIADIQERKPRVLVMMLDACRDNPFKQPGLTRSIGGETGLGRAREAEGVFSIYSAGFGQSALDTLGPGDRSPNSVFTRALIPALARTDTHLADLVIDMREEVARLAGTIGHQQYPAYYDQTRGGRVFLAGRSIAVAPAPQVSPQVAPQVAPQAAPVAPPPPPPQAAPAPQPAPAVALLTPPASPTGGTLRETWQRRVETVVFAAAISPDGRLLAIGNSNITIVNADNGQSLRTLKGHTSGMNTLAFSADGAMLASVADDDKVNIWDPSSGRLIRSLTSASKTYHGVAFSPDGREVAAGSGDKSLTVWELATGRMIRRTEADTVSVRTVAYSPDGRLIAAGGGYLKIWDRATGRFIKELPGHSGLNNSVAFSSDSQRLVTAGGEQDNRTVKLWDIASGRLLRSFAGHDKYADTVAITPDGKYVVSGGPDKEVRIWNTETGQSLQTIGGHAEKIRGVGIAGNGRRVMWGDWAGLVRVFALQ